LKGFKVKDSVIVALTARYTAHSLMLLIAVLREGIAAPALHDAVISTVPLVPVIAKYNYHIWLICYLPVALWFFFINRRRFVQFLYTGAVLSLLRGATIFVTSLGPVEGSDINAGKSMSELFAAWVSIVNPVSALTSDSANLYLTKDLFFSGHTSSTFLLLLYTWRYPKIKYVALVAHIIVVAIVFLSHLHYTIDVIGAWAITFSLYFLADGFFNGFKK
jgi:hypothetical protein